MNYGNILKALEDRSIDLSRRSVFEQELYTEEGSFVPDLIKECPDRNGVFALI